MRAPAVAIGLRAQKGGAVLVVVTLEADGPRAILSSFMPTCVEGDRLAFEPYGVAGECVRDGASAGDAATVVAEGRKRQDEAAAEGVRGVAARFETQPVAALLINRAGWITDLFTYSLEWAEHVPVAEGLAVREALRAGCRSCGLDLVELDEKSLVDRAVTVLGLSAAEIEGRLKAMGIGKPWRKDQKLACLAAWVTLVDRQPEIPLPLAHA